MTDEALVEIEERCNCATGGGWSVCESEDGEGSDICGPRHMYGRPIVCRGGIPSMNDQEFIAHARTDVPALIAEVRRLKEELKHLDDALFGLARK